MVERTEIFCSDAVVTLHGRVWIMWSFLLTGLSAVDVLWEETLLGGNLASNMSLQARRDEDGRDEHLPDLPDLIVESTMVQ